jgi:hypothetical protein
MPPVLLGGRSNVIHPSTKARAHEHQEAPGSPKILFLLHQNVLIIWHLPLFGAQCSHVSSLAGHWHPLTPNGDGVRSLGLMKRETRIACVYYKWDQDRCSSCTCLVMISGEGDTMSEVRLFWRTRRLEVVCSKRRYLSSCIVYIGNRGAGGQKHGDDILFQKL